MTLVRFAAAALLALALGSGRLAQAGTLFSDPYGAGAPDVIGNPADFDIRSLEVQTLDPGTLAINVRMNYHGGDAALQPFTVPRELLRDGLGGRRRHPDPGRELALGARRSRARRAVRAASTTRPAPRSRAGRFWPEACTR